MDDYPHQMSGGMRQRVMIAIALACDPAVLIADEPTTALDVTVQAQIFDLLREQQARGTAVLMITHDMGAVSEMADRIVVMYGGRIVEQGACRDVLTGPLHPYTQGLIACLPELDREPDEARPDLPEIPGVVPSIWDRGPGCPFQRAASGRCRAAARRFRAGAAGAGWRDAWGSRCRDGFRRGGIRRGAWRGLLALCGGASMIQTQTQTSTPASIQTPAPAASAPLLSVRDLAVHFPYRAAAAGPPPSRRWTACPSSWRGAARWPSSASLARARPPRRCRCCVCPSPPPASSISTDRT